MSIASLPKGHTHWSLEEVKRHHIECVWRDSGQRICVAHRILKVSRATMYRYVDIYKLPMRELELRSSGVD